MKPVRITVAVVVMSRVERKMTLRMDRQGRHAKLAELELSRVPEFSVNEGDQKRIDAVWKAIVAYGKKKNVDAYVNAWVGGQGVKMNGYESFIGFRHHLDKVDPVAVMVVPADTRLVANVWKTRFKYFAAWAVHRGATLDEHVEFLKTMVDRRNKHVPQKTRWGAKWTPTSGRVRETKPKTTQASSSSGAQGPATEGAEGGTELGSGHDLGTKDGMSEATEGAAAAETTGEKRRIEDDESDESDYMEGVENVESIKVSGGSAPELVVH